MSKNRQSSDAAQKGPGTSVPKGGTRETSAPGFGPAGNTRSGTSQGHSRGKQS